MFQSTRTYSKYIPLLSLEIDRTIAAHATYIIHIYVCGGVCVIPMLLKKIRCISELTI